jgi:LysM repeat protein
VQAIAEQYNVTVQQLIEYNGWTPEEADSINPGQEILIPPR